MIEIDRNRRRGLIVRRANVMRKSIAMTEYWASRRRALLDENGESVEEDPVIDEITELPDLIG